MATKENTKQIGMNDKRNVYEMVYDDGIKKAIIEEMGKIAFNPSHRWMPYKLVLSHNIVYVTDRQARWILDYFESKKIKFALKIIS